MVNLGHIKLLTADTKQADTKLVYNITQWAELPQSLTRSESAEVADLNVQLYRQLH